MTTTPQLRLDCLPRYLEEREALIRARQGFFAAVALHLDPKERVDAQALSDALWNSKARVIEKEDWVSNPQRGYLTIRENPGYGRAFRVSVLQMGTVLRVGVRLPLTVLRARPAIAERLSAVFPGKPPAILTLSTQETMYDWTFDVPDLYGNVLTMETAVHLISALFENTLQALA